MLNPSSGSIPLKSGDKLVKWDSSPYIFIAEIKLLFPTIDSSWDISSPINILSNFLSMNLVKPSLTQKFFQFLFVTKLPVHECDISCPITLDMLLSPANKAGVTKVKLGFSIPPKGKLKGSTNILYVFHS